MRAQLGSTRGSADCLQKRGVWSDLGFVLATRRASLLALSAVVCAVGLLLDVRVEEVAWRQRSCCHLAPGSTLTYSIYTVTSTLTPYLSAAQSNLGWRWELRLLTPTHGRDGVLSWGSLDAPRRWRHLITATSPRMLAGLLERHRTSPSSWPRRGNPAI